MEEKLQNMEDILSFNEKNGLSRVSRSHSAASDPQIEEEDR